MGESVEANEGEWSEGQTLAQTQKIWCALQPGQGLGLWKSMGLQAWLSASNQQGLTTKWSGTKKSCFLILFEGVEK